MRFLNVILAAFVAAIFSACGEKESFDAMGVFESDEILISAEMGGKIIDFKIKEGDELSANQRVGKIDSTQLELKKARLESELKNASEEKNRIERLFKANAGTKKSLDDAIFRLEVAQRELAILNDQISRTEIYSPIDGVVLDKFAFEGELSSPAKPLFKIANLKTLRLKAYIIDTDLTKIKLGDKVRVFSDFGEDYKEYSGTISSIADKAEFTPKTIMSKDERKNLVYAIKIDVENDGYLKIGSYGEIKLTKE